MPTIRNAKYHAHHVYVKILYVRKRNTVILIPNNKSLMILLAESNMNMKKKSILLMLLLSLCITLYGCGTKGPLYIPEKEYPQNTSLQQ